MVIKKPKVSVCVMAYNHEKYIRLCLQSLVEQETDFDFEVIVGEDCSTDNTREIVSEFANQYPSIIKPIFHEENQGPQENFFAIHRMVQGEYIANIDGDDYALPGKLKTQVDFLDCHPECNIVWHRMYIMNDSTGKMVEDLINLELFPKEGFNRADILRFITIGMNSSKMYRSAVKEFDRPGFSIVDYFMNVEQVGSGIACFAGDMPLGVYRAGIGIASSGNSTKVLLKKSFLYFSRKYPENKRDICVAALVLFLAALKNGQWSNCRLFSAVLIKVFRIGAVFDLWNNRKIIPMLSLPSAIRHGGKS
jgi:glycosyltransferase involved in cell wall biosynthesis